MINCPKTLQKHWFTLILLLTCLLRLPSLFEPFLYGDEGIYLTLGQGVRQGLVLYRDIHDNKPPILYLLAALAGNFYLFRFLLLLWSLGAIWIFKKLAEKLFDRSLSVIVATFVFAILSTLRTFEGNIANAENFLIGSSLLAFFLLLTSKKKTAFFSAGLLFSFSTLLKVPGAFDFLAALTLVFFLTQSSLKAVFKSLLRPNFWLLIIGFVTPIILSFFYFYQQGAFKAYLIAAFSQNIPYLSSWATGHHQNGGLPGPLLARGLLLILLVLGLFYFRKRFSLATKLAVTWFGFAWMAALLSARPYPHYLLQTVPPLSLAFGLLLITKKKYLTERAIPLILTVILVATFLIFRFWGYPSFSYYANFIQVTTKSKSQVEYLNFFSPQAQDIQKVAKYLKSHTLEKIFIWGDHPYLYAATGRLPVGRYTVTYHVFDFGGHQETIKALKTQSPPYIIVDQKESRPFPEFFTWLDQQYILEEQIGSFKIYHRIL